MKLIQQAPKPGQPTPYETQVQVIVTSDRIYFGFTCKDPDPRHIAIHTLRRDGDLTGESEELPDRHPEQQEQERGVEQQAATLAQVSFLAGDRSVRAHQTEPLAAQDTLRTAQRCIGDSATVPLRYCGCNESVAAVRGRARNVRKKARHRGRMQPTRLTSSKP